MLFADVAEASGRIAATSSRLAKREVIVDLLGRTPEDDLALVCTYLAGEIRQRRTGIGWMSLRELPAAATEATLTVAAVDEALAEAASLSGPGSQGRRTSVVQALFGAATEPEQQLLRGLISGEVRQGASDAAVVDAVATATDVPLAVLRRAVTLSGSSVPVAVAALTGGRAAVEAIDAEVGRGLKPMLASSAPDVPTAWQRVTSPSVDTKLDGIRIQAHKFPTADGVEVRLFTRSLDDITERLTEVADIVRSLPVDRVVLDGEVLATDDGGRARPFQDTAARTATQAMPEQIIGSGDAETASDDASRLVPAFFDVLIDGDEVLIDRPLRERLAVLDRIVPDEFRIRRMEPGSADEAQAFFIDVVAAGHEGVVIKDLDSRYEAGRRGAGWIKVKPRHTLDLVVLGVEWGSGRRRGKLSNIHLGARDGDGFVMLGKTFKGMTDEMLRWQTERFLALADGPTDGWVVTLRPEQVVEIAFDGVQRSSRYPGGVALRFARVSRYRDDKTAAEADTLDDVRRLSS